TFARRPLERTPMLSRFARSLVRGYRGNSVFRYSSNLGCEFRRRFERCNCDKGCCARLSSPLLYKRRNLWGWLLAWATNQRGNDSRPEYGVWSQQGGCRHPGRPNGQTRVGGQSVCAPSIISVPAKANNSWCPRLLRN